MSEALPPTTVNHALDVARALGRSSEEATKLPVIEAPEALGPGLVLGVEGTRVRVALARGGAALAELALSIPYEPAIGDVLLVIGKPPEGEEECSAYAIGVLTGKGRTRLAIEGDVDLRAIGGKLTLGGDRGVAISAPSFEVAAIKVQIVAEAIGHRCESLYLRARKLFSLSARDCHQSVEGELVTHAKNATLLTEQAVNVNGKRINLG